MQRENGKEWEIGQRVQRIGNLWLARSLDAQSSEVAAILRRTHQIGNVWVYGASSHFHLQSTHESGKNETVALWCYFIFFTQALVPTSLFFKFNEIRVRLFSFSLSIPFFPVLLFFCTLEFKPYSTQKNSTRYIFVFYSTKIHSSRDYSHFYSVIIVAAWIFSSSSFCSCFAQHGDQYVEENCVIPAYLLRNTFHTGAEAP